MGRVLCLKNSALFRMGVGVTCQLFNIHNVKDVKQTDIHIAEPVRPEPSVFEVEMAIETLESYKSQGTDKQN